MALIKMWFYTWLHPIPLVTSILGYRDSLYKFVDMVPYSSCDTEIAEQEWGAKLDICLPE